MTKLKQIYSILLAAYILTSLLMAQAIYNKLIFVSLFIIYGVYLLFFKKEKKINWVTYAPFLIIGIFVYGFLQGMIHEFEFSLAKQFLLVTASFLLIYPIEEFQIDMNRLLRIIAPIYLLLYAIYVLYGINIMDYDLPVFVEKFCGFLDNGVTRTIGQTILELDAGGGGIKYRSYFEGVGMMIHLGSTPFLFIFTNICLIDFMKNKSKMGLVWTLLGVLLSLTTGSRALMLLMAASVCVLIILQLDRKKQLIVIGVCAALGVGAFVYLLTNSTFFSLDEPSNSVKIGHIASYFDQLNVKQALIGDGLATKYFSTGVNGYLAHTEITLMDYWRYFGIPLGCAVYGLLIFPKKNSNWNPLKMKPETAVFLLYLLFSQTNPVLFNSFGLISVLWYWDVIFKGDVQRNETGNIDVVHASERSCAN